MIHLDRLEQRTLLSTALINGLLTVKGTPGDDQLVVRLKKNGSGLIQVNDNGRLKAFVGSQVQSVLMYALAGHDRLTLDAALPATLSGGAGNDELSGGAAGDVIWGDDGHDRLCSNGGAGGNELHGGNGDDTLVGGAGDNAHYGFDGGDGADWRYDEFGSPRPDDDRAFLTLTAERATSDGVTYFLGDDGVHGKELWRTDGTADGTRLVIDLKQGSEEGGIAQFWSVNGHAVWVTTDGRLFGSDGTAGGTTLLRTIGTGAYDFGAVVVGRKLLVKAERYAGASAIYATDGTLAGTKLLLKQPRPDNYSPLVTLGSRALWFAEGHIWSCDGTPAGTFELPAPQGGWFEPGNGPFKSLPMNGSVVFFGVTGLWGTDGTTAGTRLLVPEVVGGSGFQEVGGKAYGFSSDPDTQGMQMWVSDGTPAGTRLLADLPAGSGYHWPSEATVRGKSLLAISSADKLALWLLDGTSGGIETLLELPAGSMLVSGPIALGGRLYFATTDADRNTTLWESDGTPAGTRSIQDLGTFAGDGYYYYVGGIYRLSLSEAEGKLVVGRTYMDHHSSRPYWRARGTTLVLDPLGADARPAEVSLGNGTLHVGGTSGNDAIRVEFDRADTSRLIVTVNDLQQAFAAADVKRLSISGLAGDDVMTTRVGALETWISGGSGNDTITTGSKREIIYAGDGDDAVHSGTGDDLVWGGDGNDSIYADAGNDVIAGDNGDDYLDGGDGYDWLTGGAGFDTFDGGSARDVNFADATDLFFHDGPNNKDPLDEIVQW